MTQISIATFNVNSVKARLPNLLTWLDAAQPDIVCLQELKCVEEAFPAMEIEERGYNLAIFGQKTYNGVAILSKYPLEDVQKGLGGDDSDEQARYIEAIATVPGAAIRVASAYVPNGQAVDSDKFPYKLRFFERLRDHWAKQLQYNEIALLTGDFNCAPEPIDTWAPSHVGAICFHPEEQKRLRGLMNLGLYDAFRIMNPEVRQFSWWDYRANGYDAGEGMRIDHLLLSGMAVDRLESCIIDEVPRQQEKPSDHAPVVAVLKI